MAPVPGGNYRGFSCRWMCKSSYSNAPPAWFPPVFFRVGPLDSLGISVAELLCLVVFRIAVIVPPLLTLFLVGVKGCGGKTTRRFSAVEVGLFSTGPGTLQIPPYRANSQNFFWLYSCSRVSCIPWFEQVVKFTKKMYYLR